MWYVDGRYHICHLSYDTTTCWLSIVATLKRKILCHMTILWLLHLKNVGVYIDCNRSCVLNMTPLTSYNKLLC